MNYVRAEVHVYFEGSLKQLQTLQTLLSNLPNNTHLYGNTEIDTDIQEMS